MESDDVSCSGIVFAWAHPEKITVEFGPQVYTVLMRAECDRTL